jgi:hypothetical protein
MPERPLALKRDNRIRDAVLVVLHCFMEIGSSGGPSECARLRDSGRYALRS